MKKNPLLVASLVIGLYGLLIGIANIGYPATRPILTSVMLIKTDLLGMNLLYLFFVGLIVGVLLMKGLTNKKKGLDRPEF